jgi:hypothetical protein
MMRAAIVSWLVGLLLSVGILCADAAPIDDLREGYAAGTFLAADPDYAALYSMTSERSLTLSHVTVTDNRSAALYALSYRHEGGEYSETGVLVLHHDPLRVEFVAVPLEDLETIDMAMAGQAADIATTAAAISSGFAEANPLVSGAIDFGAGVVVAAIKLGLPAIADRLPLQTCTSARSTLAAAGWGAAVWNVGMVVGAPAASAAIVAIVSGWVAAHGSAQNSAARCAGINFGGG